VQFAIIIGTLSNDTFSCGIKRVVLMNLGMQVRLADHDASMI